jgi:starvation-inducible DNA-binding protein
MLMESEAQLTTGSATLGGRNSVKTDELAVSLNMLLADMFALYLKTKNFHWHVSGPHFRDYHLLLDAQADQIFATTDAIAERVRKIGAKTVRSIGHISELQRIQDNNAEEVRAADMLGELRRDNAIVGFHLKTVHGLCERDDDIATASLIETWLDETEQRIWFLVEAGRS